MGSPPKVGCHGVAGLRMFITSQVVLRESRDGTHDTLARHFATVDLGGRRGLVQEEEREARAAAEPQQLRHLRAGRRVRCGASYA